jgi:hypothetical protein
MVVTLIVGAIGAVLIVKLGFSGSNPTPTINGPAEVIYGPRSFNVLGAFDLEGYANTGYNEAFWTDTYGRRAQFQGDGVDQRFYCPGPGPHAIELTVRNRAGRTGQTSKTVTCVSP